MTVFLELDYKGQRDVTCPHCGQPFHAHWDTEYGDPIVGEHSVTCLECHKAFTVEVDVITIYTVK